MAGIASSPATEPYEFGNPNAEEQCHIERINRARANPPAEGARLAATSDPDVLRSYAQFGVDLEMMRDEFRAIAPAAPLAPNAQLAAAARGHSAWMLANDVQSHDQTNPINTPSERIAAAGYAASASGENVFGYSIGVDYGHAGFQVDWGTGGTGGMQAGRGHRMNIHNPVYREIGVGHIIGSNTTVGPEIVTQNFARPASDSYFGTGVAYYDLNRNGAYDRGEGIANLNVHVAGASQWCLTADGGGWALPIPNLSATRIVHFSGLGIDRDVSMTVPASSNAKADLILSYSPPAITSPDLADPLVSHTVTFTAVGGASEYRFRNWMLLDADTEECESTAEIEISATGSYGVLNSSVRHSGSSSFQLINSTGDPQTIELTRTFLGGRLGSIDFESRIAASTSSETCKVQVRSWDDTDWVDVDVQSGGAVESGFSTRTIDLSSLSGKLFRVRFLLDFSSGSHFSSTGDSVGWFIDQVRFHDLRQVINVTETTVASLSASFTPEQGQYLLQIVPLISGREFPGTLQTLSLSTDPENPPTTTEPPASLSSDTRLSGLKVWRVVLEPSFKPGKRKYRAIAKPSVRKIRIRATTATAGAKIKINGKTIPSATATRVRIGRRTPTIRILIIAADGTRKAYRIRVIRKDP